MGLSTRILANSQSVAVAATTLKLARCKKVIVLGSGSSHGVDTDWFAPTGAYSVDSGTNTFLSRTKAELTLGFIGRLSKDKGIDVFMESLSWCIDHDLKVRALIVGCEEDMKQRDLVVAPTQAEFVHFVGEVGDVRGYIQRIDVLCLPTLREGFPNVVLEAAAMGVPSVVSDATGAIDSVVDGETGIICRRGDVPAFGQAFRRLADQPEILRRMGHNARERVVTEFEQGSVWSLYESMYFRTVDDATKPKRESV
jgi:glycosyltransferase involved in cell wall biosynthesis